LVCFTPSAFAAVAALGLGEEIAEYPDQKQNSNRADHHEGTSGEIVRWMHVRPAWDTKDERTAAQINAA
jgi:hypothetical protein